MGDTMGARFRAAFERFITDHPSGTWLDNSTSTKGRQADLFWADGPIVGELKCIEKDPWMRVQAALLEVLERHHAYGELPFWRVVESLPDDEVNRILDRLGRPIREDLRDAYAQIRDTKERLRLPGAIGLAVLVNTDAASIDVQVATYVLSRAFAARGDGKTNYPDIDVIWYHSTQEAHVVAANAEDWIANVNIHRPPELSPRIKAAVSGLAREWARFQGLRFELGDQTQFDKRLRDRGIVIETEGTGADE